MTIAEKMRRNNDQDKIEIGQIVEAALQGQFGEVLRAIIAGMGAEELQSSRNYPGRTPSERVLGRLEQLDLLTERLDTCVDIKNQLTAAKKAESEVKPSDEAPKG